MARVAKPNIRRALKNYFEKYTNEGDKIAVFLSAGVDSHAVLFSIMETGRIPVVYSATLDDRESRDFRMARNTSQEFGLKFNPVVITTDIKKIKKQLIETNRLLKPAGKVQMEAFWVYLNCLRQVKEKDIASGLAADIYFVLSKTGCMHYKDKPDEYRIPKFKGVKAPGSQTSKLKDYCLTQNKRWLSPWLTDEMLKEFTGTSWDDVNKPQQKNPVRVQYKEYLDRIRVYSHTNMHQGDSGFQTKLLELLNDKDWNRWGYKSMTGVYNRLIKGEIK